MAPASPAKEIVIVTEGGPHIWALINSISDRLGPVTVVLETPESKKFLLKRRARKQGWFNVGGQIATMILNRLGKKLFSARLAKIVEQERLQTSPRPGQTFVEVQSANSPEFLQALGRLKPDVILLAGCRMLSRNTLGAIECPILNYHAGITPKYRGMNGGYWALAIGDDKNFGTTVHFVDEGVDTGGVLYQARGNPGPDDNLMIYAMRLASFSGDICVKAIEDALSGKLKPVDTGLPSRQWYHPPIWTYLMNGIRRGVW
jgi:folate-dependent phosphoribosylglycinamide formyltransferase PurN